MANHEMSMSISMLLQNIQQGNEEAQTELFERIYQRLTELAENFIRNENASSSFQAGDLINEAVLRMMQGDVLNRAPNRKYLFRAASQAMRRILVDRARRRNAQKRGGGEWRRSALDDLLSAYDDQKIDLIDLDDALVELEQQFARPSQVINEYHFGGFTLNEIAEHLNVSEATVRNDLKFARAWLSKRLRSLE